MTAQDPKVTVLDPIDCIRVVVREFSWACQNCGHEFGTVLRRRGRKNSLGFIRCERCGAPTRVLPAFVSKPTGSP
jgi:hypothetical protein